MVTIYTTIRALAFCGGLTLLAVGCNRKSPEQNERVSRDNAASVVPSGSEERVTCPVCGLSFRKADAAATQRYKGEVYYFFLTDHRDAFNASPESYIQVPTRDD